MRLHHVTCRHLLRLTLTINAVLTDVGAVTPLLPDITEPLKTSWSSTFLNTASSFSCCLRRLQKNSDTLLMLLGIHLTLCVSDRHTHRVWCLFDRVQWRKRRSRPEFGGEQSPEARQTTPWRQRADRNVTHDDHQMIQYFRRPHNSKCHVYYSHAKVFLRHDLTSCFTAALIICDRFGSNWWKVETMSLWTLLHQNNPAVLHL